MANGNGYVVVADFKTEFDMKQLIEDYERRLQTAENMLKAKDYSSTAQAERIKTKASCYRTFIAELKQQCNIANVVEQSEQLVCDICEEPLEKVLGKVCENTMCDRHR